MCEEQIDHSERVSTGRPVRRLFVVAITQVRDGVLHQVDSDAGGQKMVRLDIL